MSSGDSLISIVVPCHNEQDVLEEFHRRLVEALEPLPVSFEVVYVDDGSADRTFEELRRFQDADPRVRVVQLSRNFGHQIAVTAGVEHARGDAVVLIDADLQDPPEVIVEMIDAWRSGWDVVYGVRAEREGESAFKLWTAKAFYRLMNRLTDTPIPVDTGDFRLMDRKVVHALVQMPERDRFIRGMVSWAGFRQTPLPYQRRPRFAGRSKYPLRRMLRFALDGISSFSTVPLKVVTWMGFLASGVALLGIVYALVVRLFTSDWVSGWAALFVAVLFMGGVQLISLGIIGDYVGRTFREAKRRPLYLVQSRLGFAAEADHHAASLAGLTEPEVFKPGVHLPGPRLRHDARTTP